MTRRYRNTGNSGKATSSREEARANRRLQLVVSNSHKVQAGPTLIQQMEQKLDNTFKDREELANQDTELMPDAEHDAHLDAMLKNEGRIQGMLIMLGIMRSTNMKTELERSKTRRRYGVKPHSTED